MAEIGYRKPPKATQFKPGTSGNPKGRPKGSKNVLTLFERELHERVVITVNGRQRSVTRLEAILKRIVTNALAGDPKAILTTLDILRRSDAFEPSSNEVDEMLPANYEEILEAYVQGRRKQEPQDAGPPTDGKAQS